MKTSVDGLIPADFTRMISAFHQDRAFRQDF